MEESPSTVYDGELCLRPLALQVVNRSDEDGDDVVVIQEWDVVVAECDALILSDVCPHDI